MSALDINRHLYDLIPAHSHVLDVGCGDGQLLHMLLQKGCSGYGVEMDHAAVLKCLSRGLNVIQWELQEDLAEFGDNSFDVVVQSFTLQQLRNLEPLLLETLRVGHTALVTFPNFAYWRNRLVVLAGRMPVNESLPYDWYDTPNIRVTTIKDFRLLAAKNGIQVETMFGLKGSERIDVLPNLFADVAVFKLSRR